MMEAEVTVSVKFGVNKVWTRRQMSLETRGERSYLKLGMKTLDGLCPAVSQSVDLTSVTKINNFSAFNQPHVVNLVRQKSTAQQPTISISFNDDRAKTLWHKAIEQVSLLRGQSDNGNSGGVAEMEKEKNSTLATAPRETDPHQTMASGNAMMQPSPTSLMKVSSDTSTPPTLESQISCVSTRSADPSPYECIEDYLTEEEEGSVGEAPPPLPRKRLSYTELRLEALYDSANNLLAAMRDWDIQNSADRESGLRKRKVTEAPSFPEPSITEPRQEVQELLIDLSEETIEGDVIDGPPPSYPAPHVPTRRQSETYLQPNSSTQHFEPVYAEIRKNHIKIQWT